MNHPSTLWPRAGAISTATTIPATDAEAVENARKGLEAARILESEKPPSPPVTAVAGKLVRVNSVPILDQPKTPVEKIHRRTTDIVLADDKQNDGAEASPQEPGQDTGSGSKRKRKLKGKRSKKAKTTSGQPVQENDDENGENTQDDASKEPTDTAAPPVAEPTPDQTQVPQQATPQEQHDKRPKATASKAAAKPPQQMLPQETALEQAVKMQATPMRNDAADDNSKMQATAENLARAATSEQLPPAEPAPHAPAVPAPQGPAVPASQGPAVPASQGPAVPASQGSKPGQSGGELERQLDKEVKKEYDESQTPQESQPPGTGVKPKKRREKTPAEKAAHARYMKFSRSFERTLSCLSWEHAQIQQLEH